MAAPKTLELTCPFCGESFSAPQRESVASSTDDEGTMWVTVSVVYTVQHACEQTSGIAP
jgi:hypothetical protein